MPPSCAPKSHRYFLGAVGISEDSKKLCCQINAAPGSSFKDHGKKQPEQPALLLCRHMSHGFWVLGLVNIREYSSLEFQKCSQVSAAPGASFKDHGKKPPEQPALLQRRRMSHGTI